MVQTFSSHASFRGPLLLLAKITELNCPENKEKNNKWGSNIYAAHSSVVGEANAPPTTLF
jgi:hypothetical protein